MNIIKTVLGIYCSLINWSIFIRSNLSKITFYEPYTHAIFNINGWKRQTNISAIDFINKIKNFGVSRIIYTDINKDGTKQGPNIKDAVELSSKAKIPLVISGGVSSIEDVERIKSLNNPNIEGVIIGKAIYDGDIKINELAKLI